MGRWKTWTQIADGPFKGNPELFQTTAYGLGAPAGLFDIEIPDRAGNLIRLVPSMSGTEWTQLNLGGAGEIAYFGSGSNRIAVGKDKRLYTIDYTRDGRVRGWRQIKGPGRLLSAVANSKMIDMSGHGEILGEGAEHQLAYAFITPDFHQSPELPQWDNLGQPGERSGKKGINGRPALVGDHVLARGQDSHLWHISGTQAEYDQKRVFGSWTNMGGGITQPPVAIRSGDGEGIECFVIGEQKELQVNTWDGQRWSGFTDLGGQLQGLPAAVSPRGSDTTFVFGRGVHNKLWYRRRTGPKWQRWESVGDDLTGDPAAWQSGYSHDSSTADSITCVVLRQNGTLWRRDYQLSANGGKKGRHK